MRMMRVLLTAVLLGALMLTGCPANSGGGTDQPEPAPLKVALLLPGSRDDGGWNAAGYYGLLAVENNFPAEVSFQEQVDASRMEEAFRRYADEGYDIIFGHGAEFGEPALQVAPGYPDTRFVICGTELSGEPNVSSLQISYLQQGFLQGAAAAVITRSGLVAAVGGAQIPPVSENYQGFLAGIRYISETDSAAVRTKQVIAETWEDTGRVRDITLELLEEGYDVIMADANGASQGVHKAVDEWSGYGFSTGSQAEQFDMGNHVMLCATSSMSRAYVRMVEHHLEGAGAGSYVLGVPEGVVSLRLNPELEEQLTQEQRSRILAVAEAVQNGTIRPEDFLTHQNLQ